jgi:O-antigen ligase
MSRATAFSSLNVRVAPRDGVVPVGMQHMTVALFGLSIYLLCVHSFKLPIASLAIAIGLIGILKDAKGQLLSPPIVWMAIFLMWCTVAATVSPYKDAVGQMLIDYLKMWLIFFVAINASKNLSQLAIFVGVWVLMFALFPARGTYFNFLSGINEFGRYGWNFSFKNYNDLAGYAILALSLSAFLLASRYPRWIRWLALLSTGLMALLVIITQSRGGFLGLAIAFVLMLVRSRSRVRLMKVGGLAIVCIMLAAPDAVWERFSRMKFLFNTETISEADGSAEQRYIVLQVASAIASEHPLFGVGLGGYGDAHAEYAEERQELQGVRGIRDAHNMYMSLAAETGVPGLLIFCGMLGATLFRAMRTEQRLRARFQLEAEQLRVLRFGLVAYLIAAIFGSFHRASFLYLYVGVLWSASRIFDDLVTATPLVAKHGPLPLTARAWRGGTEIAAGGAPSQRRRLSAS